MLTEMKAVLTRSSATLIEDSLGVLALFATLVTVLAVPGLF